MGQSRKAGRQIKQAIFKQVMTRHNKPKKTPNQPSKQTSVQNHMEHMLNQFSKELSTTNNDSMDDFLKMLQLKCYKKGIEVKGMFTIPMVSQSGGVLNPNAPAFVPSYAQNYSAIPKPVTPKASRSAPPKASRSASPKASRSASPKPVTPKASRSASPKPVTPKASRSASPKASRSASPKASRSASPKPVTPKPSRSASPKAVTPKARSSTESPTESPESSQSSLAIHDYDSSSESTPKPRWELYRDVVEANPAYSLETIMANIKRKLPNKQRKAKRDASSLLLSIDSKEYIDKVLTDFQVREDDSYLKKLEKDARMADNLQLICTSSFEDIPDTITLDNLSKIINSLRSTATDKSDIDLINLDLLRRRTSELENLCLSGKISKGYGDHILSAWRDIFNEITILISDLYKLGYKKIREEITIEEFTDFFKQIGQSQLQEDGRLYRLQDELLFYLEQAVSDINSTYPENSPLYVAKRYYSGGFVFFFYTSAQLTNELRSDGTTQEVIKINDELGIEEDLFHITIHTGNDPLTKESYLGKIHSSTTSNVDARAKFNRRVNLYPILLDRHTSNAHSPERIVQLIPYYSPVVVNNAFVRKSIPFILGSINEFLYLSQMRQNLKLSGNPDFTKRAGIPNPIIRLRREPPPPRQTLAAIPEAASAAAAPSSSRADAASSWRQRAEGVSIKKKKKKKKRTQKSRYDTIKI
jgi:hypothetical protein